MAYTIATTLPCVLVTCLLIFYIYLKRQLQRYGSIDKYPGPTIGKLLKIGLGSSDKYETFHYTINLNKKYGPVVKLWIKPFAPALLVSDVEFFKKILISKDHLCKTSTYDIFKCLAGDGLTTIQSVDDWRNDRKLINPEFNQRRVEKYLPSLEPHVKTYINLIDKRTNVVVDLQEIMHLLSLDIVYQALCGQTPNFQNQQNRGYLDARTKTFDIISHRLYSPLLQNEFLFKMTRYYKEINEAVSVLDSFSENLIKKSKIGERKNPHFLDCLMNGGHTEKKIKSQFDTFLIAAADSSALAICFVLFELSRRPEVQQKVIEEIESILTSSDGNITANTIHDMKYLDSVIKETMRLHAVAPLIERITGKDTEINGVMIPKDTKIIFNIHHLHMTEEYFKDAESFDPERFLPENMHKLKQYVYAPFSLGPRDCIGKHFAVLVIRYLLIRILSNFKVLPVEPMHTMEIIGELVAKSRNGIPVIFKRREAKSI